MEKNFYLSSHGSTSSNLFIDKDRNPPVYPIEGIPDGVMVEIHYKIKGGQMQSVLIRQDSLSKISKLPNTNHTLDRSNYNDYMIIHATGRRNCGIIRKVEIFKNGNSHVFYEPDKGIIENVPNIEYSYEGDLFTSGLLELENMSDEYDDEMQHELAELAKCFSNEGGVIEQAEDRLKAVLMYEGNSQMLNDYDEGDIHLKRNDEVEVTGRGCGEGRDSENYLVIEAGDKSHCILASNVKPKFYTGSSWDTETFGYLHSSRPESWRKMKLGGKNISSPAELNDADGVYRSGCFKDQSFLNMLFGGGEKNWDSSLYLDFPGFGRELKRDDVNIVNIYGSHCLNPEEHLSFGNVIPFILGKPGLWAHLFKDELLEGARKEIANISIQSKLRTGDTQTIEEYKHKFDMAEKAVRAMEQINQQNLGPVLHGNRKRRKKTQEPELEPEPEPEPAPPVIGSPSTQASINKKNKKKKQTKRLRKNKKKKQTKLRAKNKKNKKEKQTKRRKK
jgi:hypothetical protein